MFLAVVVHYQAVEFAGQVLLACKRLVIVIYLINPFLQDVVKFHMMPCYGQFHEFQAVGALLSVYLFHNTVCASVDGIGLLVCEFDDRIEICLHPMFGFDNITQMNRQVILV